MESLASQGSLASPGRLLLAAVALDCLAKAPVWQGTATEKAFAVVPVRAAGSPTHPDGGAPRIPVAARGAAHPPA